MDLLSQSPYDELPDNHIRLLQLAPGAFDDHISVSLTNYHITEIPHYEALSYVWGIEKSKQSIYINGYPLTITENLNTVLRYLRYKVESRTLWIDAICINQESVGERSQQVQLMATIYSAASDVLVWLGPARDWSDLVIDYVQNDGDIEDSLYPRFAWGMIQLMERPWFSRVWVLQEVALASKDPTVICGLRSTPLSRFVRVLSHETRVKSIRGSDAAWLDLKQPDFSKVQDKGRGLVVGYLDMAVLKLSNLNGMMGRVSASTLTENILRTQYYLASDPRDKVYGLIGISGTSSGWLADLYGPQISTSAASHLPEDTLPDYSKSVSQVFAEAMLLVIHNRFSLCYGTWSLRLKPGDHPLDLPSWVPNISSPSRMGVLNSESSKADFSVSNDTYFYPDSVTKEFVPKIKLSADTRVLSVIGVIKGRIMHVHRCAVAFRELVAGLMPFLGTHSIPVLEGIRALDMPSNRRPSANDYNDILDFLSGDLLINAANIELIVKAGDIFHGKTLFVTDVGYWGTTTGNPQENDLLALLFGANVPFVLRDIHEDAYSMIEAAYIAGNDWKQEFPSLKGKDWDYDFSKIGLQKFNIC